MKNFCLFVSSLLLFTSLSTIQLQAEVEPGDVVINEFVATNDSTSGNSDPNGDYDDWVEIYNTTNSSIDLAGFGLSDVADEPFKWEFPANTTIEADGYLVVWIDNDTFQNGLHAYFRLNSAGEPLIFTAEDGTTLESFEYGQQIIGKSSSRIPNGTGNFQLKDPTILANNESEIAPLIAPQTITINEIIATNDSTSGLSDELGEFDDWVEFYNNSNSAVDLSGYFLTDNQSNFKKWAFPWGTVIPANDYLIVWPDRDPEQVGVHTNFNLASEGEILILSYDDGTVIDSTSFDLQVTNISYARLPNGTGDFSPALPTYNAENQDSPLMINPGDVVINEFMSSNTGSNDIKDELSEFDDWIELFNNTSEAISLRGFFLSDSTEIPRRWTFPDVEIPADGFLIVWADNDEEQGDLHTNFNLSKLGESVILSYLDGTIIDQIDYEGQADDVSFARKPNGTGDFEQTLPTFNADNTPVGILESFTQNQINLYPNPSENKINIDFSDSPFKAAQLTLNIVDLRGMVIDQNIKPAHSNQVQWDIQYLAAGSYFIEVLPSPSRSSETSQVTAQPSPLPIPVGKLVQKLIIY